MGGDRGNFIKINDGYKIDIDEPKGFIKIGHIDKEDIYEWL